MTHHVEIYNPDTDTQELSIKAVVQTASYIALWGCKEARIEYEGELHELLALMRKLGRGLRVRDGWGNVSWHGQIASVLISGRNLQTGVSLDNVANRVKVVGTTAGSTAGQTLPLSTAWYDDTASQDEYGVIEAILRVNQTSPGGAIARAQQELEARGRPKPLVEMSDGSASDSNLYRAVITAVGWAYTAARRRYGNTAGQTAGRIQHITTSDEREQYIGRQHSNRTQITFSGFQIQDADNGLLFNKGDVFIVTGSTYNNGVRKTATSTTGDVVTLTAAVTAETPASVNFAWAGLKNAQAILVGSTSFRVREIRIRARKVGAPTDNLLVQLCANSGGNPGAVLATATIPASDISPNMQWLRAELDTIVTLSANTAYCIVVSRSGATDAAHYYMVGVDGTASYGLSYKHYDNNTNSWFSASSAWWGNRNLLFALVGEQQTTDQMATLFNSVLLDSVGGWFSGFNIRDASGIYSDPYRDEDKATAFAVLEELLTQGSTNKRPMLLHIDDARVATVYEMPARPAPGEAVYRLMPDGRITIYGGQTYPVEALPPNGYWLDAQSIIDAQTGAIIEATPAYAWEWQWGASGFKFTPYGANRITDITRIQNTLGRNNTPEGILEAISPSIAQLVSDAIGSVGATV